MNLFDRAKNVLLSPANEWEAIKAETLTVSDMFTKYAIILAAIPAIAGFIGYLLIGVPLGFASFKLSVGASLGWAISTYILSLVGVFIVSFIIDALAPSFASTKDMVASTKVAVFAYTASWVAGIFQIIPTLSFVAALGGIYSLVLLYMGLQRVKDVPKDKMIGYFVVILIVAIVVYVIIGMIVASIAFGGLAAYKTL
jgi:Yip1 domain